MIIFLLNIELSNLHPINYQNLRENTMDSKKEKLEELEEQLVLLYRFVSQNNSLKRFYYEGVDVKPSFKDETGILTELIS